MVPPFDLVPSLLGGVAVTVELFAGSVLVAIPGAFAAGLGRLSPVRVVRWIASCYIEFFRGTSALVQLYWAFFALPFIGIQLSAMQAGMLVLGLNAGSYGAEVVRGAIQAIPREQYEAAVALNFTPFQRMTRIILPQASVAMIPPATNLLIELIKNTSLASLITISELTFRGQVLRTSTLRTTEIFGLLLLLYLALAAIVRWAMKTLEKRASSSWSNNGGGS